MRKLILVLGLTCAIAWFLPHVSTAKLDPETAMGVWLFDENRGNTAEDSSGKEHHGTLDGANWTDGKFGTGLEFDGGQSVSIESTPELQLSSEFTMMAWFFATDIASWRQLIAKNAEYLLRIDTPAEQNKMSAFVHLGGWEPRASARVPELDKWIHFAATYDENKNSEQLVVYVDGKQAGASTRVGSPTGTSNPVTIGRWNNGSYFFGIIDEVAIFNTVLSEADLGTIMEHGLDKALGGVAAVDASNKLATTWGTLKADR